MWMVVSFMVSKKETYTGWGSFNFSLSASIIHESNTSQILVFGSIMENIPKLCCFGLSSHAN